MSASAPSTNPDNHSERNQENFNLKPIPPEGIFSFACHPEFPALTAAVMRLTLS